MYRADTPCTGSDRSHYLRQDGLAIRCCDVVNVGIMSVNVTEYVERLYLAVSAQVAGKGRLYKVPVIHSTNLFAIRDCEYASRLNFHLVYLRVVYIFLSVQTKILNTVLVTLLAFGLNLAIDYSRLRGRRVPNYPRDSRAVRGAFAANG